MILQLQQDFSVGLHDGGHNQQYGTGANLCLKISFKCQWETLELQRVQWSKRLSGLIQQLDHKHPFYDHTQLKGRKLTEMEILKWAWSQLCQADEAQDIQSISLSTQENFELSMYRTS